MWEEATFFSDDRVQIHYYTYGEGPPLVWLSGGPGESHHGLRTVARGMASRYQCVLYDQRGCGASTLSHYDENVLHIEKFTCDLENLRLQLGAEQLRLIGHSWGAMLALAYSVHYPERVAAQALVSMGPLDPQGSKVVKANLCRGLDRNGRYTFDVLKGQLKVANANHDEITARKLHERLIADFYAPAWLFNQEKAKVFATSYRETHFSALIAQYIMPSWYDLDILSVVDGLRVPTLVLYGNQDVSPIHQGYLLAERMPYVLVRMVNECGHIPWLDQPELFYEEMGQFFADNA